MKAEEQLQSIIEALDELDQDTTIPKNVKIKIGELNNLLKGNDHETSTKVNEALHILDEIADDTNLKSYTRTQIWNLVSLLEKI